MIEPQILYGVTCDRCGETLINSNDNSAWYDRSTAEEEASEEDWHSVSSHHYCPNCYREDDDGNRTIKAPFPYYVQKINRFMNRIANPTHAALSRKTIISLFMETHRMASSSLHATKNGYDPTPPTNSSVFR